MLPEERSKYQSRTGMKTTSYRKLQLWLAKWNGIKKGNKYCASTQTNPKHRPKEKSRHWGP